MRMHVDPVGSSVGLRARYPRILSINDGRQSRVRSELSHRVLACSGHSCGLRTRSGPSTAGAMKRYETDQELRAMADVRTEIEEIVDRETRAWGTMDVELLQDSED